MVRIRPSPGCSASASGTARGVWATGQAWWQGPQGPYWGHNALIRIAPFRQHARLPLLPDGGAILSHDHVEAALLQAAGWAVRVLPEDAGSAERHPPDLQALFSRDLRWAAGNLQYRHLLRRRDLGALGRFQMLQAILHYALTPLWFALLPLAAVNAATGGGEGTSRGALLALLACGARGPEPAEACRLSPRPCCGPAGQGRWRLLAMMGQEVLLGLMVDAIAAFDRTRMLLRLAGGLGQGWEPQARAARGLRWAEAGRRFGPQMAAGLLLAALFASAGAFALLAALPALAGLLLAVPVAVLTARPDPVRPRRDDSLRQEAGQGSDFRCAPRVAGIARPGGRAARAGLINPCLRLVQPGRTGHMPVMKQMSRTYRRALVTGATGGIGGALARALPVATDLLLTGRNAEALAQLVQELARPGRRVDVVVADLGTDPGREAGRRGGRGLRHRSLDLQCRARPFRRFPGRRGSRRCAPPSR